MKDLDNQEFDIPESLTRPTTRHRYNHPRLTAKLRRVVMEKDGILTDRERMAITLYIYESRTLKQSSHIMHCSKQIVSNSVKSGIKKLKVYFG